MRILIIGLCAVLLVGSFGYAEEALNEIIRQGGGVMKELSLQDPAGTIALIIEIAKLGVVALSVVVGFVSLLLVFIVAFLISPRFHEVFLRALDQLRFFQRGATPASPPTPTKRE